MTDREKQLIMQDLCARLPYGVKVSTLGGTCKLLISFDIKHGFVYLDNGDYVAGEYSIDDIKPYLRSMEDMTDEEVKEFYDVECIDAKVGYIKPTSNWHFTINGFDWLNKHHFDYRGLIEKELAIRVTKENNPYKN